MNLPSETTIEMSGLLFALGLGALVFGVSFILNGVFLAIQIWKLIAPKTDGFASASYVAAVEARSEEKHRSNDARFASINAKLDSVQSSVDIIIGKLEGIKLPAHK